MAVIANPTSAVAMAGVSRPGHTRSTNRTAAAVSTAAISGAIGNPDGSGLEWTAARLEEALRAASVDGVGIKPRLAFGPVRTAVSGQRISPPLFESMEILGKNSTLRRLAALRASL